VSSPNIPPISIVIPESWQGAPDLPMENTSNDAEFSPGSGGPGTIANLFSTGLSTIIVDISEVFFFEKIPCSYYRWIFMFVDVCSGMYNLVRYASRSSRSTCDNGCDNSVSPAGSDPGDRNILVRNLGHDVRWRLLP